MPDTPTREVERIYQGEDIAFLVDLQPDYTTAGGWTLKYGFSSADGTDTIAVVTASDNGDGRYLVEIADTITSTMAAGRWRWQRRVEHGSLGKKTLAQGRLEVRGDLIAGGVDLRSHVEMVLDSLTATINNKATRDQLAYSINGRSLSAMSPAELLDWENTYLARAAQLEDEERQELGLGVSSKIITRL